MFCTSFVCHLYMYHVCTLIPRKGVERVNKILQILQKYNFSSMTEYLMILITFACKSSNLYSVFFILKNIYKDVDTALIMGYISLNKKKKKKKKKKKIYIYIYIFLFFFFFGFQEDSQGFPGTRPPTQFPHRIMFCRIFASRKYGLIPVTA